MHQLKFSALHISGAGIVIASLPELGPGGSWTTCMMGCQHDPPRDVAHIQFHARIAFKLVWYVLLASFYYLFSSRIALQILYITASLCISLCCCYTLLRCFLLIYSYRAPPRFATFVIVDDDGVKLAQVTHIFASLRILFKSKYPIAYYRRVAPQAYCLMKKTE